MTIRPVTTQCVNLLYIISIIQLKKSLFNYYAYHIKGVWSCLSQKNNYGFEKKFYFWYNNFNDRSIYGWCMHVYKTSYMSLFINSHKYKSCINNSQHLYLVISSLRQHKILHFITNKTQMSNLLSSHINTIN